jgi:hypothetical protein
LDSSNEASCSSSPPVTPLPVGSAPELSSKKPITFRNGNTAVFSCSLIQPVTPNGNGIPIPPLAACRFSTVVVSKGRVTVSTHIGAYDPSDLPFDLPSTNDLEYGVGNWRTEFVID